MGLESPLKRLEFFSLCSFEGYLNFNQTELSVWIADGQKYYHLISVSGDSEFTRQKASGALQNGCKPYRRPALWNHNHIEG